jgi:hypothetical protein
VAGGRRALPENLIGFVELFQVLRGPCGEHLACSGVVLQDAPQRIAATGDRETDREGKLVAGRAVRHRAPAAPDHHAPGDQRDDRLRRPLRVGLVSGKRAPNRAQLEWLRKLTEGGTP